MAKGSLTRARPYERRRGHKTASKIARAGRNGKGAGSWGKRSIEELAAEQGIKPTRVEDILGKGAHLWDSDEDLENFVRDIYRRRKEDRELSKR